MGPPRVTGRRRRPPDPEPGASPPPGTDRADPARRQAAVGRLAGALAHELGTPLTVVQLRADLLAQEALSGSARRELEELCRGLERLSAAVRVLQRAARPARQDPRPVPIGPALAAALRSAGVQERVRAEPWTSEPSVWADPETLGLALPAWLGGAAGGGPGRLAVGVRDGRVELELRSEAPGEGAAEPDPARSRDRALAELLVLDLGGALTEGGDTGASWARLSLPAASPTGAATRRLLVISADARLAEEVSAWCASVGHDCRVLTDPGQAWDPVAAPGPFHAALVDPPLPPATAEAPTSWLDRLPPELVARAVRVCRPPDRPEPGERALLLPFTPTGLAERLSDVWDR